ncbi:MAG: hypothetical protein ABIO45_14240 [Burkholderiaceae bacterium]
MRLMRTMILCTLLMGGCVVGVSAEPIVPTRDDQVIEVLPGLATSRLEERRARRALAQRPNDPALAVGIARRLLARAHDDGDPRFAGQALAAISGWSDSEAPDDVLLLRADLQQYLHEFDAAVQNLQRLVARPSGARVAQAWLTLATVRRVQGRYADSDAACSKLPDAASALYASACAAENAALRGEFDAARASLARLLATPGLPAATKAWLLVTRAEMEERAGRIEAADVAFRTSLELQSDSYARLAYADFLIAQRRPSDALKWLAGEVRSDPVLLRLAIAGKLADTVDAARDASEMRERISLANLRPDAKVSHGREQAMFALAVEGDPVRAVALARGNVAHQREPLDLVVFAQAAKAAGDATALQEARALTAQMGLHDQRIQALL